MATRSFISRFNPETEMYESIYCHWDGYPQGVGVTLRDNYSYGDEPAVLMTFGDISSLKPTLFETMKETYKLRGDSDVDAKIFRFMSEMIEHYRGMWCEYGYIFRDGKWKCYTLEPQEINLEEMEAFTNA